MSSRRERLGTALLRAGADLRLDRLATARRIEESPLAGPGRDLALAQLRFAAWVDALLLWAGWRLCPRDTVLR
jgi:hypothetical protein